jgi:hypothetical protein
MNVQRAVSGSMSVMLCGKSKCLVESFLFAENTVTSVGMLQEFLVPILKEEAFKLLKPSGNFTYHQV